MLTGLQHLHHAGEYLVVIPIVLLILSLAGARSKPGLAKLASRLHSFAFMMPARLVYLVGFALLMMTGRSITEPFILVGLIGWVPVEIVAKRMVKAELAKVAEGGEASNRLTIGAGVEFALIMIIVIAMEHGH